MSTSARLRELPSVDRVLRHPEAQTLLGEYGRELTTEAVRFALEDRRRGILAGVGEPVGDDTQLLAGAAAWLDQAFANTLRPVINATGVIVHTNLGRAPLGRPALAAIEAIAPSYSTLEFDLDEGQRGSRLIHAERLLTQITGAEAALVVNNNAAAVLLMLTALCKDREVVISRGQMIEIGGGFRIPDVMRQSGAQLLEVGTTNRTHLRDYETAISERTAAILVAHYSNYKVIGFTSQPEMAELAELARRHNILLLFDQGSGALLDVAPYGLEPEATVQDGLAAGADVVAFSGDKLLGGPQAGILCGGAEPISAMKRHPLARAVRADKLALAALSATLRAYLSGTAVSEVPVWWMIARPLNEIAAEVEGWAERLGAKGVPAELVDGESRVGGGSLPGTSLPTKLLALRHTTVDASELAQLLRAAATPVIGRVQDDRLLLDPRAVLPDQTESLLQAVLEAWRSVSGR